MAGHPLVIVLGGPNGAGKSTAARHLLSEDVSFVNADEIAKTLPTYPSPAADLEAGRLALELMEGLAGRREDFAVETTLAGRSLATRASRLRQAGYLFRLIYLYVPDPRLSVERVAARVRAGGHDIPVEVIGRRYHAGLKNLFRIYLPLADSWDVHDNSSRAGPRLIAEGARGGEVIHDPSLWNWMKERASDEP